MQYLKRYVCIYVLGDCNTDYEHCSHLLDKEAFIVIYV
jgi:hypothetical protein